jgi:hypothetical protein
VTFLHNKKGIDANLQFLLVFSRIKEPVLDFQGPESNSRGRRFRMKI